MADGSTPVIPAKPRFHEHLTGEAIDGLPPPNPCPFCGQIKSGGIVTNGEPGDDDTTYHVQCDCCGAEGSCAGSEREAALKWNAATQLDAPASKQLLHLQQEVLSAGGIVDLAITKLSRSEEDSDANTEYALRVAYGILDRLFERLDPVVFNRETQAQGVSNG